MDAPDWKRYRFLVARTALKLRHHGAASPARVAAAALFLDALLKAAAPKLAEASITMVVENESLRSGVRPRDEAGRRAVRLIGSFLKEPKRGALRIPGADRIAAAVGHFDHILDGAIVEYGRTVSVVLNDETATTMRAIARSATESPQLRGTTTVHTKVLRVGRTTEDNAVRARVEIGGALHDLPVADQKNAGPFFEAARSGEVVSVVVATAWRRDADGRLVPDPKLSKVVSVEAPSTSMTGRDLVDAVRTAEPGAFEDIDSIMEDLGGWRTGTTSK